MKVRVAARLFCSILNGRIVRLFHNVYFQDDLKEMIMYRLEVMREDEER